MRSISEFLGAQDDEILGTLTANSEFAVELPQRQAWLGEIAVLRDALRTFADRGWVIFEFVLPRLGRRVDVVLVIDHLVFVLEFKVGESVFTRAASDQVWDYALDLKNFHATSHKPKLVPVLIATDARQRTLAACGEPADDGVFAPTPATPNQLESVVSLFLASSTGESIDGVAWEAGQYSPTPTIVEAARALYAGHSVEGISRSDAGAINLAVTSQYVCKVIDDARRTRSKAICLLTGVPGAGKTLVGLDIATTHMDAASELHSVFLSGNGPLVAILREALARDQVERTKAAGKPLRKGDARRRVETFIQNVHHFRDDCLADPNIAPPEHVTIFDEAQRAWNRERTSAFMKQKRGRPDFDMSEPDFLISCMDRHKDWAVILCLIGGGQEINTGEAGITEWIDTLRSRYSHWHVHLSPKLLDAEYASGSALNRLTGHPGVTYKDELHLSVSKRSFRAETVSDWVKFVLDIEVAAAQQTLHALLPRYPIYLTRSLPQAKQWLKARARGNERFGLMVSSQAQRLKPHAIDVRAPLDPVHWFLDGKEDVRSSFYLEDAATEFHVQGLELDWACVVWDADFRASHGAWDHWSFEGSRWKRVKKAERQTYLKNAYRVLLTRARQGMVLVVPEGDGEDRTRDAAFFDATYDYLRLVGIPAL